MTEEQKPEDEIVEEKPIDVLDEEPVEDEDGEDLPSILDTAEDLKGLGSESLDRAKSVGLNPVREVLAAVADTVEEGLDSFFRVFERKRKQKRNKPSQREEK